MADDTPDTPEINDVPAPENSAPRRRAAPRKAPAKLAPRQPKAKGIVTRAEEAVSRAAAAAKGAVVEAEERVVRAVKPRSTKRATPAKRTGKQGANEASAKRSTAKGRRSAEKSTVQRATEAVSGRWGTAALASVAAAGVTAALLTLRGSSGRDLGTARKPIDITGSGDKGAGHPVDVHGTAHQPDGTDSTASFQAGIADENTVPDTV